MQVHLDIRTTNSKLVIHNDPLRLVVQREPAKMHVRQTRPKMKVNWAQVRSESGLRSLSAQRRYLQQMYRQMALDGIAKISSESERISDIQDVPPGGPDIVAMVALDSFLQEDVTVVDVANMPRSMPDVEWEEGKLEIEWESPKLEMHWEGSARPDISVTPYTVEIRLVNGETVRVGENEAKVLEREGRGKRLNEKI